MSDLVPDSYAATLDELKKHVHAASGGECRISPSRAESSAQDRCQLARKPPDPRHLGPEPTSTECRFRVNPAESAAT